MLDNPSFIKSAVHYIIWGYKLRAVKISSISCLGVDPGVYHIPVFYGPVLNIKNDVAEGFISKQGPQFSLMNAINMDLWPSYVTSADDIHNFNKRLWVLMQASI